MAGCADNPGVLFRPGRVLALVLAVLLIGAVVVLLVGVPLSKFVRDDLVDAGGP